jgi:hypothetical protein
MPNMRLNLTLEIEHLEDELSDEALDRDIVWSGYSSHGVCSTSQYHDVI